MSKEDDYFKEQDKKKKEYEEKHTKVSAIDVEPPGKLDAKTEKKIIIILVVMYLLLGLYPLAIGNFSPIMFIYYFGLAFFAAGTAIGISLPGGGLIFLFSHGLTGAFLMLMGLTCNESMEISLSLHGDSLYSYIMSIGAPAILFILGFAFIIVINLSKKLKQSIYKYVPFLLLYAGLLGLALYFS